MIDNCAVLVTGANRGLGFEVARQLITLGFKVIVSSRKKSDAVEAAERLQLLINNDKSNIIGIQLDVCSKESLFSAQKSLRDYFVGIIVNNAGIFSDDPREGFLGNIFTLPINLLQKTLDTNLIGSLRVIQAFMPDMIEHGFGRIVNVASGMGRSLEFDSNAPYYRLSKSALISLTKICALSSKEENIKINAVCPGWVRTRMGGNLAVRSVEEGAKGIVFAATLPKSGPSGELLRDGRVFNWEEPKEALNLSRI